MFHEIQLAKFKPGTMMNNMHLFPLSQPTLVRKSEDSSQASSVLVYLTTHMTYPRSTTTIRSGDGGLRLNIHPASEWRRTIK